MLPPDTRTWSGAVADLQDFLQEHAKTGVYIDAALCGNFAEVLDGVREAMASVETYVETLIEPERRTPAERRRIVLETKEVPGSNVLLLPFSGGRAAAEQGMNLS